MNSRKPLLTEGRARSLAALAARIPADLLADEETAAGAQYLAELAAWRLAEATKARLAQKVRANALTPSGIGRYTGRGRGRKPLLVDSTNS